MVSPAVQVERQMPAAYAVLVWSRSETCHARLRWEYRADFADLQEMPWLTTSRPVCRN